MNANVAIQVLPSVLEDEEIVRIVDEVIAYIASTGVNYYVGPCETAMEGDYEMLMDIVKECQYIAVRAGAPSVMSYVKITYKPDGEKLTIERKTAKHHINDAAKRMKSA
ncbi:MAG: thiamine-binding protein [Lachnospiraceae bacterium]|nr:thiamine-binding protein [Lachnospiraceae bacterium]